MSDPIKRILLACVGPIILVMAWQAAASPYLGAVHFLPLPGPTFVRVGELLRSADFIADLMATLERWAAGFALAVLVGTPLGLLLGMSPALDGAANVVIDFFRSLPVTAAFPIFLVILGVGDATIVTMIFFASVFIVIMNASYGVRSTSVTRQIMAKSFGATPMQIFIHIRAVEALAQVLMVMRMILSLSLVVAIVSEMFIGVSHGIGQRLYLSYQLQSLTDLYAIVLIAGILGYLANRLFRVIERSVSL